MKYSILVLFLFASLGCNKKKFFAGPNFMVDDFESYDVIDEIIDGNNQRWSFFQKTFEDNIIEIDTTIFHSGNKSVKCFARGESGNVSKASINKQFMAFWSGEVVSIEAWYYIPGNQPIEWLSIADMEEKAFISLGPGVRLAIVNNKLLVSPKLFQPDIHQFGEGIPFPRNQWVHVRFETKLSQKKEGYMKVWQNDTLIIEHNNWKTLPSDILYGVQGTKGMYDQIEFGITASTSQYSIELYVDAVDVHVLE